jgi:hypothetical protein
MDKFTFEITPKRIDVNVDSVWTYEWQILIKDNDEKDKFDPAHLYLMCFQQLYILLSNKHDSEDEKMKDLRKYIIEEFGINDYLDNYQDNIDFLLDMIFIINEKLNLKNN